ncbi:hypothetical protein HanPSC8_Chr04g0182151 [Helianthus annuus]|nr:hypothetical protein HanPSC8_Chr04g0182151 [Helianthus annuus]
MHTKELQLMHLRLGGSFIKPLIIFSFRSSSLLLLLILKYKLNTQLNLGFRVFKQLTRRD